MAAKKSATRVSHIEHHVGKFLTGDGKLAVKVRYPFDNRRYEKDRRYDPKAPIYEVLDRYPPGSDLNVVSRALAKLGACFVPWDDGSPGNYSTPRHPVYK